MSRFMGMGMGSWQGGLDQGMHVTLQGPDDRALPSALCGATSDAPSRMRIVSCPESMFCILSEGKLCPDCVHVLEQAGRVVSLPEFDAIIGPDDAAKRRERAADGDGFLATKVYLLGGRP